MVAAPSNIQERLERILPTVRKPGRYTGGELNQVVKNWQQIETRVALVFPDIYDLGMSNLGLAILYELINQRQDALAERVFSPWLDMEQALRDANLPLYSLETRHLENAMQPRHRPGGEQVKHDKATDRHRERLKLLTPCRRSVVGWLNRNRTELAVGFKRGVGHRGSTRTER